MGIAAYGYATAGEIVVAACVIGLVALQVVLVAARGVPRLPMPGRAR